MADHNFGDIRLFTRAFEENPVQPSIGEYLRSTGLSESEVAEVQSLYTRFCAAIADAPETSLPDLADGSTAKIQPGSTSLN